MRLVVLREIPEDDALRRQWDALVEQVDQPQVFFTYEWGFAVQRAYGDVLRPYVILGYDEAHLCGVAALALEDSGELSFLCATTADYCDFLTLPAKRQEFVDAVFAEIRKLNPSRIVLTNVPAESGSVLALKQAAGRENYWRFARTAYFCSQVSLKSLRGNKSGPPNVPRKKMLTRSLNALGREGPVSLLHCRSNEAVASLLDEFMLAHVARFLAMQKISNVAARERRMFLSELGKLLSTRGWLALTCLQTGGKKLAWNYGFNFLGTWFWYQPTFDTEYEKHSPGFCLLAKIVEEAIQDQQLSVVDLGLGAEGYKDRFANQTRETLHITLQPRLRNHVTEIIRYNSAQAIKAFPSVEDALRRLRDRLHTVNSRCREHGLANTALFLARQLHEKFWAEKEVFFYEWIDSVLEKPSELKLLKLNLKQLAAAVIEHIDDKQTRDYLLRSADRIGAGMAEGFALVDARSNFLHFAWTRPFNGFFLSELNTEVESTSPAHTMLFDCWTPLAARGRGHYANAIELIAEQQREQGKRTWIFSAAGNVASLRGIEKAGFKRRYSLARRRTVWWHKVRESDAQSSTAVAEMSARV